MVQDRIKELASYVLADIFAVVCFDLSFKSLLFVLSVQILLFIFRPFHAD